MIRLIVLRRLAAVALMIAYLSTTAFFLYRHALGDPLTHPIVYFWTWDMFPNYPTESHRRMIIGQTGDGRHVQLFPNRRHRFRWGVHGNVTRLDLTGQHVFFRDTALDAIRLHEAACLDNPDLEIQRVYLVEQYWPVRYNFPDDLVSDLYEDESGGSYSTASSSPVETSIHKYWRVIEQADVGPEGTVSKWEPSP